MRRRFLLVVVLIVMSHYFMQAATLLVFTFVYCIRKVSPSRSNIYFFYWIEWLYAHFFLILLLFATPELFFVMSETPTIAVGCCVVCNRAVSGDCRCRVCDGRLHCFCAVQEGHEGHGAVYLCVLDCHNNEGSPIQKAGCVGEGKQISTSDSAAKSIPHRRNNNGCPPGSPIHTAVSDGDDGWISLDSATTGIVHNNNKNEVPPRQF